MMKIMAEGVVDIANNLKLVRQAISETTAARSSVIARNEPRLVAVSKRKSVLMIKRAYDEGQRHFGESYVKELLTKAKDVELQKLCPDIKWHFVGHLQKNKISQLLYCPQLFMVETISSYVIADSYQRKLKEGFEIDILIQVNTSKEENKGGIEPEQCANFAAHIRDQCKKLKLKGLMTIGRNGHDFSMGPNPDFDCLVECGKKVSERLQIPESELELSMGMSADFKEAIIAGSTNVRIGSTIFGPRE